MEDVNISLIGKEKIVRNVENAKMVLNKQVELFKQLLVKKISEYFPEIDLVNLNDLLLQNFSNPILKEIDELFSKLNNNELEFYKGYLKTVDLIYKSIPDNRTKTIYIDNVLKKINLKNNSVEDGVLDIIGSNGLNLYDNMNQFVAQMSSKINLDELRKNELNELVLKYYGVLKQDIISILRKLFIQNNQEIIQEIENVMDLKQTRGKTTATSKLEREITRNAILLMDKLLSESIGKNKELAVGNLKICSSSVTDSIFKSLPIEFLDQKELLEVIIDTNINERLSKLLEEETAKLRISMNAFNNDKIENEFYEEKRYKKIDLYNCDFDLVNKVYQDVLHEIRIAYDIPLDTINSKKIDMIILSETNSTKIVLKKMVDNINFENKGNLNNVIEEMHNSKDRASNSVEFTENKNKNY